MTIDNNKTPQAEELEKAQGKVHSSPLDCYVMVDVEIIEGVKGSCLVINDNRVCGPKPWGGGRVTQKWRASAKVISEALMARKKTR